MATRGVRLERSTLFWSTAVLVFVVRQVLVLDVIVRLVRPRRRLAFFLFHRLATPRSLLVAVAVAGLVTLLAELLVRLVVVPLIRAWLAPQCDSTAGLFRLGASEHVLESTPARRRQRGRWAAGTLIRTNRRIWFEPGGWDSEPWSVAAGEPVTAHRSPVRGLARGLLTGLPDRLAVRAEGVEEVFAVAEPDAILAWFLPSGAARPAAAARL
jgi:hypothetical protein